MSRIRINMRDIEGYANICVPVELKMDLETNLHQEEIVREVFTEEMKNKVIPPVIDLEKTSYVPMYVDIDNEFKSIEEIEFNFHFRTRDDSWTVVDEGLWNGISSTKQEIDKTLARKSDLLKYLNFTLDDVRYQQMKIKKSFARLSFYDSKDPLTQQLLNYSTIYLDTTELYGKYANIHMDLEEQTETFTGDNSKRLDTRITIYDKFDTTKSSEGFYLYLFNSEVDEENDEKDIYMKVEFNHAGYGKTLLFMKPYPGSTVSPVPVSKVFNYTYIHLKIKYLNGKYVYYLPTMQEGLGCYVDKENNKLVFNLFEVNIE